MVQSSNVVLQQGKMKCKEWKQSDTPSVNMDALSSIAEHTKQTGEKQGGAIEKEF